MSKKGSAFTPKRIRRSIKLDRVQASDFLHYEMIYSCEQCSYFAAESQECLLGFPSRNHLKAEQLKTFSTLGHMAFCRFLEID
jgi:hypothetical protein